MKSLNKFYKYISVIFISFLLSSCFSYSTDFNEMQDLDVANMDDIKKGQACSHNLFGGFKIPYIGDTAIRLTGNESVITAIKKANVTSVYAIDSSARNWILYSKRCTIVFGQ